MGIFSSLFSKKEKLLPPADLSVLGTDVHSHFIPGIDDGSKSFEESVELLQAMQNFGYKKVITTPHIMSDYYRNTPEIILSGLEKVREAALKNNLTIQIDAAAEYYLDFDFEEKIKNKTLLTFGKNYVLFELPFVSEPQNLSRAVFEMQMAGYKPVLAHVERYGFWHNSYDKIVALKDKGVLMQLNLNSITGYYCLPTKKIAEKLIDENMIDLVGTDCHNMNHIQLLQQCRAFPALHKIIAKPELINKML